MIFFCFFYVLRKLSSLQEIQDLQEQVRDLMFYFDAQKKIQDSPQDTRQVCVCWYVCVCVLWPQQRLITEVLHCIICVYYIGSVV